MLTRFFFALREAGIPVSLTEHLTLLKALEAGVAGYSVDDFYYLARAAMVKDEKHFDRFDRAFAAHFKGIEQAFASLGGEIPAEWLRKAHGAAASPTRRRRRSRRSAAGRSSCRRSRSG